MARTKKTGRSAASRRGRGGKKSVLKLGMSGVSRVKATPTRISERIKGRMKNSAGSRVTDSTKGSSTISLTATTEYLCYRPNIKQQCWALTSLKAPFYEPSARASVDIVAVIDKSGSMRGEKIALVKETLLFVIDQLKETDRLSLVVYDTNVELVFGLMKMTEKSRERAKKYVSSIVAGTSTNLYGGLIKGMEQVALTNGREKAKVQSVLLLTDGLANYGFTHTTQIVEQMELMQSKGLGAVTKATSFPSQFAFGAPWSSSIYNPFMRPFQQQQQPQPRLQQQIVQPFSIQAPGQMQRKSAPSRSKQTTQQVQRQSGPPPSKQTTRQLKRQSRQTVIQLQRQRAPPPPRQTKQKSQRPSLPQQTSMQSLQQSSGILSQASFIKLPPATSFSPPSPPPWSAEEMATDSYKFDGTVYTFGFGSDHDAHMLEAISTQGGGVYYYIDTNDKIPESFADCLGGLLSVMGQNVSVKLQAQGDTSFNKVHTSKSINWTKKKIRCEISLGDIQSEESRDLVLELELPRVPSGTASENVSLVSVELSYFNVITSQLDTVQCQLTTDRKIGDPGPGNVKVDIQRNRVLTADALKKAEDLGNNNKLKEAEKILKETVVELQSSISKDEGLVKLLIHDLNQCLETMKTRELFQSRGKNYMRSKLQTHRVQRSNFVYGKAGKKLEAFGYGNKSKVAYRLKSKCKK